MHALVDSYSLSLIIKKESHDHYSKYTGSFGRGNTMHTVEQYSMMWVKLQQDDDYALINHHSLSRNKEGFLLNRPLTTQLPFSVFNLATTQEELYCPLEHSLQSTPFGNHTYEKKSLPGYIKDPSPLFCDR